MKKKILSIIVPFYNETCDELFIILSSICTQLGVCFEKIECILVNDGNQNIISDDFLLLFKPLKIRVIYLSENRGAGMARQAGLNNANGDYVMFCDADDSLQNALALKTFLDEIANCNASLFYSSIVIEEYDRAAKKYIYSTHTDMLQVMHGKVYKRSWLLGNDIRFHEHLRFHEDTYFNNLAYVVCAREEDVCRINKITYIQRYRQGSLTRKTETDYSTETMPELVACSIYICDEVAARRPELLLNITTEYILYFYFMLHTKKWIKLADAALKERTESMLKERLLPRAGSFKIASDERSAALYYRMRSLCFADEIETELLEDWLKRLNCSPRLEFFHIIKNI